MTISRVEVDGCLDRGVIKDGRDIGTGIGTGIGDDDSEDFLIFMSCGPVDSLSSLIRLLLLLLLLLFLSFSFR